MLPAAAFGVDITFNLTPPGSAPCQRDGGGVRWQCSGFLSFWFRCSSQRDANAPPARWQGGRKGAAVPRAEGMPAGRRTRPGGGEIGCGPAKPRCCASALETPARTDGMVYGLPVLPYYYTSKRAASGHFSHF